MALRRSDQMLAENPATTFDPRAFRETCAAFATGVNVITTRCDGLDHGMTANAFMSISLGPPLIAISVGENARIRPKITASGRFAISVLPSAMAGLAQHFAGKTNPALYDPFEPLQGLPVVRGALAQFATTVHDEVVAGDHTVFIGRVDTLVRATDAEPLVFFKGGFGSFDRAGTSAGRFIQLEHEFMW